MSDKERIDEEVMLLAQQIQDMELYDLEELTESLRGDPVDCIRVAAILYRNGFRAVEGGEE